MMTAERWYEYQDSYRRHGFDMKPATQKIVKSKPKSNVTGKDKARLVLLTIFVGILCIGIIVTTAYTADVKYEINRTIKENTALQGEIENLNVKIKEATNIKTIEERAVSELGMVYPAAGESVFVQESKQPGGDFAMLLKEQAYN